MACQNKIMPHHPAPASHLSTNISALLDGLPWLHSVVHRQATQPWQAIPCGNPPEPVSTHVARFRREWRSTLQAIASSHSVIADTCDALLALDPLDTASDRPAAHVARITPVLTDRGVERRMCRERDRQAFAGELARSRKERGWSIRRLARECVKAVRRLGFGVRAPDRWQLMDFERGRSNANLSTKRVLAAALGVSVNALFGTPYDHS
jgi:hypothetical protein